MEGSLCLDRYYLPLHNTPSRPERIRAYFEDMATFMWTGLDESEFVLKEYLEGHTDAQSTAELCIRILRRDGVKANSSFDEYNMFDLGVDVVDLARNLPCVHHELLELLRALSARTETSHLLGLDSALSEQWDEFYDPGPEDYRRPDKLKSFLDLNVFVAQLYNSIEYSNLDFLGCRTFDRALAKSWRGETNTRTTDITNLDAWIPPVLAWIDLAGPKLWEENPEMKARWEEWKQYLDGALSLPAVEKNKLDANTLRKVKETWTKMRMIG